MVYHEDFETIEQFLSSLPENVPIIFDFTNFGGCRIFGSIYEDFIEEYKSPNIFWLLPNWGRDEIRSYQIEIEEDRMFLERNQLLKELK